MTTRSRIVCAVFILAAHLRLCAAGPSENCDGLIRSNGVGFAADWAGQSDPVAYITKDFGANWRAEGLRSRASDLEYPLQSLVLTPDSMLIGDSKSLCVFELSGRGIETRIGTRPRAASLAGSGSMIACTTATEDELAEEVSVSWDGGRTWSVGFIRPHGWYVTSVFSLSRSVAFVFGLYRPSGRIELAKTQDGGAHWIFVDVPSFEAGRMFFADERHGWLFSFRDFGVLLTRDGGETWEGPVWDELLMTNGVFFGPTNGVSIDLSGRAWLGSDDGGRHWQELDPSQRAEVERRLASLDGGAFDEMRFLGAFLRKETGEPKASGRDSKENAETVSR